ncbi:MAG: HAD family hydrolase [Ruminococcaceae bacterium]|nr:HAD family hydrolase [Oscillospiraceae bacterium]
MNYKTYLFDFDGTLVDSMPSFVSVMLGILDENKIEYTSDIVKIITPLGYLGSARYFRELGVKNSEEELVAFMNERAKDLYLYKIEAKNNVKDVLFELKKRGASLNVLTASPHKVLDPCLKRLGLFDLFENVWSCDDFSTTKSDPNIYKMAAKRMNVPVGDVLFLDDNFLADKTAKEAGMKVCGVFDEYSRDFVDDIKEVADHYIYDFSELLSL